MLRYRICKVRHTTLHCERMDITQKLRYINSSSQTFSILCPPFLITPPKTFILAPLALMLIAALCFPRRAIDLSLPPKKGPEEGGGVGRGWGRREGDTVHSGTLSSKNKELSPSEKRITVLFFYECS